MVRQCYVCKKSGNNDSNLTYHRFPLNQNQRKLWCVSLGFDETKIVPKTAEICSNHFESKNFSIKPSGRTYLTRIAVPKLFHPEILRPKYAFFVSSDSTDGGTPPKTLKVSTTNASPIQSTSTGNSDSDTTLFGAPEKTSAVDVEKLLPSTTIKRDIYANTLSIRDIKELMQTKPTSGIVRHSSSSSSSSSSSLSSSSTLTASETEAQFIKLIDVQHKKVVSPPLVGPDSGYKGKLALLSLPKARKRRFVGDMTIADFSSPIKARINFQIIKNTIQKQRNKISCFYNTVRRLKSKINTLNDHLKVLKEKLLIAESSQNSVKATLSDNASIRISKRFLKGPKKQKCTRVLRSSARPHKSYCKAN